MLSRCFLAAIVAASCVTPAIAADDALCKQYANLAYNEVRFASTQGGLVAFGGVFGVSPFGAYDMNVAIPDNCGLSGPRWSEDKTPNDYYDWCRGQDDATAAAEMAAMDNEFKYCSVCLYYVNAASSLENKAKADHCGRITGANWPTSADGLLQFCLSRVHTDINATVNRLKDQLKQGQDQINACLAFKEQQKFTMRRPTGNAAIERAATKPPGKRGNEDALADPNCLHCKSTKSAVKGPDQERPGAGTSSTSSARPSAADILGNVNSESGLNAVGGSAGGAASGGAGSRSGARSAGSSSNTGAAAASKPAPQSGGGESARSGTLGPKLTKPDTDFRLNLGTSQPPQLR